MTPSEWAGAVVEPATGDSPPPADDWTPVEVPGRPGRFAGEDAIAYRTRFSDPRSGEETRAVLELSGLYAHARIWHNGELLGTHDTYFVPARFEFEPTDENEIVVQCRPPQDRFGGVYDTDLVPATDAVPGIWWGASVETYPDTFVDSFTVTPNLETEAVDVTMTVDAREELDDRITFSLRPEGFPGAGAMERQQVSARSGERVTVERAIEVRDPERWWPRGVGPQNRYTLRASFRDQELSATTGFRSVRYDDDTGLLVNDREIAARGFNILTGAADDPERAIAKDVERAVDANANLLRAHAHVPPATFYSACDEAGVLIWQDLPLTGSGGYDVDRGRTLARSLVEAYGHHPSIATYGIHDDPRSPFESPVGTGRLARYRMRWRAWRTSYDSTADERVAEAFPEDVPVFPVIGAPGIDPDAATIYPGWDYGTADDATWVLEHYGLGEVVAEFGAGAFGSEAVDAAAGFDEVKHSTYVPGEDPDASQAYQARVVKTVAETLRNRRAHAITAFSLRDVGAAGMGVLGRDGTPKRGYEALTSSFEPAQAICDPYPSPGASTTIVVINDSYQPVVGTVAWKSGEESGDFAIEVDSGERSETDSIAVPSDASIVELSVSLDDRTIRNEYDLTPP